MKAAICARLSTTAHELIPFPRPRRRDDEAAAFLFRRGWHRPTIPRARSTLRLVRGGLTLPSANLEHRAGDRDDDGKPVENVEAAAEDASPSKRATPPTPRRSRLGLVPRRSAFLAWLLVLVGLVVPTIASASPRTCAEARFGGLHLVAHAFLGTSIHRDDDAPGGNGPGRLWKATKAGVTTTFTYDANGNRTGAGWAYDDQDRLTASPGGVSYAYSAGGELATRTDAQGTTTYTYDALGNLRSVSRPAPAATIDYLVDGRNRRVGKKVGGVLQQVFLYDEADRLIAELDGAGAVVSRFVYGARPHVPEYMIKSGTTYRLVTDHLGSVRLVVQVGAGSLTIAQRYDFDSWGQITFSDSEDFQPFGFAGGLYDPDTGLVRFGARDYDPAAGRWTSKDPLRFGGGDANLYAYVGNDPVNLIDPRGASGFSALHLAFDIAGLIPGAGEMFDLANAALYLAEGDCLNAGISLAAAIPGFGATAVLGGRLAARAKGAERTFEIIDGVRRSKAAELAHRQTVRAEVVVGNRVVETLDIPLASLRSPSKSAIDVSSSRRQFERWQSVLDGTKRGDPLPPITVQPGSRGPSIFDVFFE